MKRGVAYAILYPVFWGVVVWGTLWLSERPLPVLTYAYFACGQS